jgi:hypothetical protein
VHDYAAAAADPSKRIPDAEIAERLLRPLSVLSLRFSDTLFTPAVPPPCVPVWQNAMQAAVTLTIRALLPPAMATLSAFAQIHPEIFSPETWARFAALCALTADPGGCLARGNVLLATAAARTLVLLLQAVPGTSPQLSGRVQAADGGMHVQQARPFSCE